MPDTDRLTANCLTALEAAECVCGKPKRPRYSFCKDCYYKLPRPMRDALYSRIRQGYEQAYLAACQFLIERWRTEQRPQLCEPCRQLSQPGEVTHESRIRCPHCSLSAPVACEIARAYSADSLYRDGEAELTCVHCEQKFTVQVRVRYEYTSPSIEKPKPKRARRSNRQEV